MKQKIVVDTIELNGKIVNVYLCDRKAKCKKSNFCGNVCMGTLDEKHAVLTDGKEGQK